ncbi:hypothetical protein [Streptomyces lavendulae]|uniref:hypothetical protein n=1 Tax=Streptomyces lavendulae TaxID=1914 RepID=UPI00381287CA
MRSALRNLHLHAGALSCREIERCTRTSADTIRVPLNTTHQILTRQRFLSSRNQLRALLSALGVLVSGDEDWLVTWSRVHRRLQAPARGNLDPAPIAWIASLSTTTGQIPALTFARPDSTTAHTTRATTTRTCDGMNG